MVESAMKARLKAPVPLPSPPLTVREVGELIHKSPTQVRNMRARGQLPAPLKHVPGYRLCWSLASIEKWLAAMNR